MALRGKKINTFSLSAIDRAVIKYFQTALKDGSITNSTELMFYLVNLLYLLEVRLSW